jgi:serine/threonine protein kinase
MDTCIATSNQATFFWIAMVRSKLQTLEFLKQLIRMEFLNQTLLLGQCLIWSVLPSLPHSPSSPSCVVLIDLKAPERIANEKYGFPGDIWSFGLSLLAVAQGRFPFSEGPLDYWELYRLICEEEAPTAGEDFTLEFNDLISSCLQKNPAKRPTAAMLMQHPFFLKHASVILRAAERSQLKRLPKSPSTSQLPPKGGGSGGRNGVAITATTNALLNLTSADGDDIGSSSTPPPRVESSSSSCNNSQSALSRHTENRLSSHAHSRPTTPSSYSVDYLGDGDAEEDTIINAIRFQHLESILEKIDTRYRQYVEMRRRDKEQKKQQQQQQHHHHQQQQHSDRYSSCRSMMSMSSKSFFKSINDPLTPVPNLTSYVGRKKWEYLARQLHLSIGTVTDNAVRIIHPKFFAKS